MKRKNSFFFLLVLFLLAAGQPLAAQIGDDRDNREDNDRRREPASFSQRLWYGGGIALGFSAFNGQSAFGIGVSPMVGYKILPTLSIGPRVAVNYTAQKIQGLGTFHLFDTEAGAFLRWRVWRGIFLQGEVSNEWLQEPAYDINGEIVKQTFSRGNQYLGAGWNSSRGEGGWGTEIGIFYNFAVASDINSYEQPWDYRFGITYNF